MKKVKSILLALLVILASVVPYNIVSAESGRDISNHMTIDIKYELDGGKDSILAWNNRSGKLSIDWKIDDAFVAKPGDKFSIKYDNINSDVFANLLIGDFTTCVVNHETGSLDCELNENVINHTNIEGLIEVTQKIKQESIPTTDEGYKNNYHYGDKEVIIELETENIILGTEPGHVPPVRKTGDLTNSRPDYLKLDEDDRLIEWTIWVNEGMTYPNQKFEKSVVINDKLSVGHHYAQDKNTNKPYVKMYLIKQPNTKVIRPMEEGKDFRFNSFSSNSMEISIDLNDHEADLTPVIEYYTVIEEVEGVDKLRNDVSATGNNDVTYRAEKEVIDYYNVQDSARPVPGELKVIKRSATTLEPIANVEFEIYSKKDNKLIGKIVTDQNGEAKFNDFNFNENEYHFYLKEVSAPDEYKFDINKEIPITPYHGEIKYIWNEHKDVNINVQKLWNDKGFEDYRPDEIEVELLRDDIKIRDLVLSEDNNWFESIRGLEYLNPELKTPYEYKIREINVAPYYESKIETNNEKFNKNFLLTNQFMTTEVSGEKHWIGDEESNRPESITVELFANENKLASQVFGSQEDWKYNFSNLAKFDKNGNEIKYSVREVAVPGYVTEIDGFDIFNTFKTTEVSGNKSWLNDNEKFRPDSIVVELYANGEKVTEQTVTQDHNWMYEFKDLPEFDENGKKINYAIKELPVKGYTSKTEGFDLLNTLTATVSVEGKKIWQDDNVETSRPDYIEIELYANGVQIDETKVSEESNWEYQFENLHKFDKEGNEISYSIKEKAVNGYTVSYEGNNIINTRNEQFNMTVNKEWIIVDSDAEKAPITIVLTNNAGFEKEVTITEEDNWTYTFENLEKFDENGKILEYNLVEKDLEGFTSEIQKSDDGFTVINTANPTDPDIPEENPVEPTEPEEPPVEEPEIPVEPPVEEPEIPVEPPVEEPEIPVEPPVEEPEIPVEPPVEEPEIPVEPPVEEPEIPVEPPVEEPEIPVEPPVEEPEEPEVEEVLGVSRDPETPKVTEELPEVEAVLAANRPPVLPQTGMGFSNSVKLGFAMLVSGVLLVLKKKED